MDNKPENSTLGNKCAIVLFTVAQKPLAVRSVDVAEIFLLPALIDEPGAPELLAGFVSLGGKIISVIRLEILFGWPLAKLHSDNHLILLKSNPEPHFIVVDRVSDVIQVDLSDIKSSQIGATLNDCVTEDLQWNGQGIPLLNIDKLLIKEETEKLAELKKMYESRIKEAGGGKSQ